MSGDDTAVLLWFTVDAAAFWGCYRLTKKIAPESRWEPRAWLKAACRAFPWIFLLTPSMAFGYIPLPMPAGLLLTVWLLGVVSGVPHVQGPHNATGPIACLVLILAWSLVSICTLFGLRLAHEEK